MRTRFLVLASLFAAVSTRAHADPSASDRAVAEQLFQDGRKLLTHGKVAEACPKFAESQKMVPKLGTLLNLATCHEDTGKTASAWAEFTQAEALAIKSAEEDRARYARQHIDQLAGKLARLVIELSDRPEGIRVELDDQTIGAAAWGTPIPVDPGDHAISVTAPGKRSWKGSARAEPGPSTARIVVPALAAEAAQHAPGPPTAPPVGVPPDRTDSDGTRRVVGWAALGLGAVGVGVGSYFGVRTFSLMSDSNDVCDGTLCNQHGVDLRADAHTAATISTIAFAAGAVTAAVGVVLLLTASPGHPPTTAQLHF